MRAIPVTRVTAGEALQLRSFSETLGNMLNMLAHSLGSRNGRGCTSTVSTTRAGIAGETCGGQRLLKTNVTSGRITWSRIKERIMPLLSGIDYSLRSGVTDILCGCTAAVTRWKASRTVSRSSAVDVWDLFDVSNGNRFAVWTAKGDVCVSNCLGIQFGMGAKGIAVKVSDDTKRYVPPSGGEKLLRLHKRTFADYWAMLKKIDSLYGRGTPLQTRDNWILFCDNPNKLSVRNFPIQGNAASIGRESVCRAWEAGLPIISPLHDCDYGEFPIADAEEMTRRLIEEMDAAVETILGTTVKIRIDTKQHHRGELWVEDKAKKTIEMLEPYLDSYEEWAS